MANISDNSLAAIVASSVENVQFQPTTEIVPRKFLIIGTYDPLKTAVVANVPVLITSPEDAGDKFGFGFMINRLAKFAYKGHKGIETWVVPQAEPTGNKAAGSLDFGSSTGVLAGTLYLYIGNEQYPVAITDAMTEENIADAVVAKINSIVDCPFVAEKTAVTFIVTLTAKGKGTYYNEFKISFNEGFGEVTPTGIAVTIVQPTGGTGTPDIQDALDSLGTGDGANEYFYTDLVHGYLQDSTTLDAVRDYVGAGNDFVGLYDKAVHKPFRSLNGDVVADTAGLSALISLGNGRKSDRASGIIAVPGSKSHPAEIAAQALGIMTKINNNRAEESYVDQVLFGIHPGAKVDRWTSEYNNRDTAVKAGISPTKVVSGEVHMQNVVTFYHPDNVPQTSNGYRSMRNISILQNILYNQSLNFEQAKWKGISIVDDVQKVSNVTSRQKARDVEAVKDDLVALVDSFMDRAWIYTDTFSKDQLKAADAVVVRTGGDGFTSNLKVILSGEGNILNMNTQFDTSIAVTL